MFGRSHEAIRQVLAKYDPPREPLLSETSVVAKLGYPVGWVTRLWKEDIISPAKRYNGYLYSEEQVRQIPLLIAERRRCERCGELRPPGYPRFCRECSQYRKKHPYLAMSLDEKARHIERCLAWRKKNPERWQGIQFRTKKKGRAKVAGRLSSSTLLLTR